MHTAQNLWRGDDVSVNGGTSTGKAEQPYTILEQPSWTVRPLKVIVIGAGASAINFAHEVGMSGLEIELVCYDKNPSIGGTWYENRYPV